MGKIVVSTFVTLDGVMEDPHKWSFDFQSEDNARDALALVTASDALLLGRTTYEGFAAAWPGRGGEFADKMNSMPKYVASTTLTDPSWDDTTVLAEDVVDRVRALKGQDTRYLLYGSGRLTRTLMEHDLIDEYKLLVAPIVLGGGKRLFPEGTGRKTLRLTDTKAYEGGMLALHYAPAAG